MSAESYHDLLASLGATDAIRCGATDRSPVEHECDPICMRSPGHIGPHAYAVHGVGFAIWDVAEPSAVRDALDAAMAAVRARDEQIRVTLDGVDRSLNRVAVGADVDCTELAINRARALLDGTAIPCAHCDCAPHGDACCACGASPTGGAA